MPKVHLYFGHLHAMPNEQCTAIKKGAWKGTLYGNLMLGIPGP